MTFESPTRELAQLLFDRLSQEDRGFLVRTSAVDQMDAKACLMLANVLDGQARLERLSRETPFVERLGPHWFKYHDEFRDFLLSKLRENETLYRDCLLYTSPSPRDGLLSRMPSSA